MYVMFVCLYICYVCMCVMFVCLYVCYVCMFVYMLCLYVCYVCMYVMFVYMLCLYVCYVCMYVMLLLLDASHLGRMGASTTPRSGRDTFICFRNSPRYYPFYEQSNYPLQLYSPQRHENNDVHLFTTPCIFCIIVPSYVIRQQTFLIIEYNNLIQFVRVHLHVMD